MLHFEGFLFGPCMFEVLDSIEVKGTIGTVIFDSSMDADEKNGP